MLLRALPALLTMALGACTDDGAIDAADSRGAAAADIGRLGIGGPAVPATCATPRVERLTGSAGRTSEMYPDDVAATVTWQRVGGTGCVDRYSAVGELQYGFAIPGALCTQTVAPATQAIGGSDATLAIDRTTSPATYVAHGATTWTVTWSCRTANGDTESISFAAGGTWLDASGTLAGPAGTAIVGDHVEDDGTRCGQGASSLPCTYRWSFDAAN